MTQTNLEILAANPYALLVTFTWGDVSVARYTSWNENLTVGADTFTSEPRLEVELSKPIHSGTDDSPAIVQLPDSVSPISSLIRPYAHAKVDVLIEEVLPGTDATRRAIFFGRIGRVVARPAGRSGLAKATVDGIKRRFTTPLGVQSLTTCPWRFGDANCGFDLAANTVEAVVQGLSTDGYPTRVSLSTTNLAGTSATIWNRGYLEYDGLRIAIRAMLVDDVSFRITDGGDSRITRSSDFRVTADSIRVDLRKVPPPEWDGQTINVVPGCDKTIATCRIHDREESFGGIGYAMPTRNPVFEES